MRSGESPNWATSGGWVRRYAGACKTQLNEQNREVIDMPARQGPISNHELGRLLGVTHSQVSRIRKGERRPSIELMFRIDEVLGWSDTEQFLLVKSDWVSGARLYAETFEERIQAWGTPTCPGCGR